MIGGNPLLENILIRMNGYVLIVALATKGGLVTQGAGGGLVRGDVDKVEGAEEVVGKGVDVDKGTGEDIGAGFDCVGC